MNKYLLNRRHIYRAPTIQSFVNWFKANYDNLVKLNDVRANGDLPNLLASGGADDTLLSGNVVQIDGENWVDGYVDIGITSLAINSKTYLFSLIPNNVDIDTTAAYAFQFYVDANNLINVRFSTTAGQLIAEYVGQSVSETIAVANMIQDKIYHGHVMTANTTEDMLLYLNGLLQGAVTLANDIVGTDIDNVNTAIGASDTSGSDAIGGYVGEVQVTDDELTYYQIRYQALYQLGYTNPLGFHNRYGVRGDGLSAYLSVSAASEINNIFDGGGTVAFEGVISTPAADKRLVSKRSGPIGWVVYVQGLSGTNSRLGIYYDFSTGASSYYMDTFDCVPNEPFMFMVDLVSNDVSNKPTLTFIQNGVATTYTDGDGLGGTVGSGTRTDDSAIDLGILADASPAQYLDGEVYQCAMFNTTGVNITALGQDWSKLSPVAYWKMGDYIDATNIDNILTTGTGTIYDVSDNGNDATPTNMDHDNLIETRPTDYLTVLVNLDPSFDYMFYGYGSSFRQYSTTNDYGTNTARDGEDWQGFAEIAFDGATSYIDLSSLITGTIPPEMVFLMRISLTDWIPASNEYLAVFSVSSSNHYRFFITTAGTLSIYHRESGNLTQISYDASSEIGYHTVAFKVTINMLYLYFDGQLIGTPQSISTTTGTLGTVLVGAQNTTPLLPANGNLTFFSIALSGLTDAEILAAHNQLARVED